MSSAALRRDPKNPEADEFRDGNSVELGRSPDLLPLGIGEADAACSAYAGSAWGWSLGQLRLALIEFGHAFVPIGSWNHGLQAACTSQIHAIRMQPLLAGRGHDGVT